MIDISDILLIERDGQLYKSSLENLQLLYLPKHQNDKVVELENTINELSAYITELSGNIIKNYTPISELSSQYELRLSTDYMTTNPNILDEDEIYEVLAKNDIVTKDELEDSYSNDYDKCEQEFEKVANKIDTSWFS